MQSANRSAKGCAWIFHRADAGARKPAVVGGPAAHSPCAPAEVGFATVLLSELRKLRDPGPYPGMFPGVSRAGAPSGHHAFDGNFPGATLLSQTCHSAETGLEVSSLREKMTIFLHK